MSQKSKTSKISSIFKWVLAAICLVFGINLAVTVISFVSTGIALATIAFWGLGILAVGGGLVFAATKLFGKKK